MLNDATAGSGLWGPWHDLTSNTPSLRMCAIEKIGTKHWRKLFEALNADSSLPANNMTHGQRVNQFRANGGKEPQPPPDAPKFVFLRDPLERFLSAYLDKCVSWHRVEKHCEPLEVFHKNASDSLLQGLSKQQKFAAYVDAMPLTWNLHFYPQSFYCDGLFRHLGDYDFVGTMGPHLYQDLDALGKQFGLEQEIVKAFGALPVNQDQCGGGNGGEIARGGILHARFGASRAGIHRRGLRPFGPAGARLGPAHAAATTMRQHTNKRTNQ